MVRNTPYLQTLRGDMSDLGISSSSPGTTLYENSQHTPPNPQATQEQQVSGQRQATPFVQLCGDDEYTKQLMNRVATGSATQEEQIAFAERVRGVRPQSSGSSKRPQGPAATMNPQRSGLKKDNEANYRAMEDLETRMRENCRRDDALSSLSAENVINKFDWEALLKNGSRNDAFNAEKYTKPFCDFLTENPTVFHAVDAVKQQLKEAGFTQLSERDSWDIKKSGKYFVERNGSSMIAFVVGGKYEPGNGAAILAGHVDALTTKLKPVSAVPNKAGYVQLGVAPYAGAPNNTWWDRDLGIGGRVLVKEGDKIVSKLVKLDWPIARIPTLAPHFGAAAQGPFNPETQMVPIIGLDSSDSDATSQQEPFSQPSTLGTTSSNGSANAWIKTQPPRLVRAIGNALGLNASTYSNMVNWELELFDTQPAQVGGLDKEFIFAGRIDDKLCSWAAIQALLESEASDTANSSTIKVVGLFDNEEIGSLLRQGARGNLLPTVIERAVGSLANHSPTSDLVGRTYANSFMVSSDVIHAVNPNFLSAYLENHSPHLNVGLVVSADSNGHMTTDSVSTAILQRCADKVGAKLQVFQIRNDSRSGGTVGPMLSSATGIRAIDAGIPQLSMHSIRATTGSKDPGLGVLAFRGFLDGYESVDKEFR